VVLERRSYEISGQLSDLMRILWERMKKYENRSDYWNNRAGWSISC
jgi:hypothetical protein